MAGTCLAAAHEIALPSPAQTSCAGSQPERRRHSRQLAILRFAMMRVGTEEVVCVARNISPGGIMLDVLAKYRNGQKVDVLLSDEECLSGCVAWQRGGLLGIQFDSKINVPRVLGKTVIMANGQMRRMPRISIQKPARLKLGCDVLPIEILNISVRGVKIAVDRSIAERAVVTLLAEGLDPIIGSIRWQSNDVAGIEFGSSVPIEQLMAWCMARPDARLVQWKPRARFPRSSVEKA